MYVRDTQVCDAVEKSVMAVSAKENALLQNCGHLFE